MSLGTAVLSFAVVATVLTLTPGLDTALVLRAALAQGRREAAATAVGIVTGLLVWGAAAAVGVFYVALLPQFLPAGSDPLAVGLLLAAVHGAISLVWFAVLIALAGVLGRRLRSPRTARAIDGVTGATLIGFGVRLVPAR